MSKIFKYLKGFRFREERPNIYTNDIVTIVVKESNSGGEIYEIHSNIFIEGKTTLTKSIEEVLLLLEKIHDPTETISQMLSSIPYDFEYYRENLEPILWRCNFGITIAKFNPIKVCYTHRNLNTCSEFSLRYDLITNKLLFVDLEINDRVTKEDFWSYFSGLFLYDSKGGLKPEFEYLFSNDPKETLDTFRELEKLKRALNNVGEITEINENIIPDRYSDLLNRYKKLCERK